MTEYKNKTYFRKEEICSSLKIGKTTFYRLANRKENPLPTVKLNGAMKIPAEQYKTWLESQRIQEWNFDEEND